MLKRLIVLALIAVPAGWYVMKNYDVSFGLARKDAPQGDSDGLPPVPPGKKSIRIATFNANPLNQNKVANRKLLGHLVGLVRRFDIVALQNVQAESQNLLAQLVRELNAEGRYYNFATGPGEGGGPGPSANVFLFDQATVEIDPSTVCLVADPARRLRHPPLVAAFRVRGPEARQAFTFTLINFHTSSDRTAQELDLADTVFRAVRDDGRNEDDVILLGDLGADERRLAQWRDTLHLACAVSGTPSTTRGTQLADNVLFDSRATVEFSGQAEVLDVMRELNLNVQEASELSDHLPVWAEFSVFEGGDRGLVAARPQETAK
jgi:deoxyribonuclease-1-like protein